MVERLNGEERGTMVERRGAQWRGEGLDGKEEVGSLPPSSMVKRRGAASLPPARPPARPSLLEPCEP